MVVPRSPSIIRSFILSQVVAEGVYDDKSAVALSPAQMVELQLVRGDKVKCKNRAKRVLLPDTDLDDGMILLSKASTPEGWLYRVRIARVPKSEAAFECI